jgi:hypothetical protein
MQTGYLMQLLSSRLSSRTSLLPWDTFHIIREREKYIKRNVDSKTSSYLKEAKPNVIITASVV